MALKIVHSTITDRERQINELSDILITKWRAKAKAKKNAQSRPRPRA